MIYRTPKIEYALFQGPHTNKSKKNCILIKNKNSVRRKIGNTVFLEHLSEFGSIINS